MSRQARSHGHSLGADGEAAARGAAVPGPFPHGPVRAPGPGPARARPAPARGAAQGEPALPLHDLRHRAEDDGRPRGGPRGPPPLHGGHATGHPGRMTSPQVVENIGESHTPVTRRHPPFTERLAYRYLVAVMNPPVIRPRPTRSHTLLVSPGRIPASGR